jgi:hypothetical protein
MIQAIETTYKGYRFRSRLEARWALFFDAMDLQWEYEVEGFELSNRKRYLPDFWLPVLDCFAEVKPKQLCKKEYKKCSLLDKPCLLLDTGHPLVSHGYYITKMDWSCYSNYIFNSEYGRILLGPSKSKNRLWFLFGEKPEAYWLDLEPETMAKSARFES